MVGNNIVFIGRLVRDIEVKSIGNGTNVANFALARDRFSKDKENKKTDFVDFVAWGATAENLARYFKKGDKIAVRGRIQTDINEYEGHKIKQTVIVVDEWEFVDSKSSAVEHVTPTNEDTDIFQPVDDEDLPF